MVIDIVVVSHMVNSGFNQNQGAVRAWFNDGGIFTTPKWKRVFDSTDFLGFPTLADLYSDNALEILIGSSRVDQKLYALDHSDGTDLPGFPVPMADDSYTDILVGDATGDGEKDIVIADPYGAITIRDNLGNIVDILTAPLGMSSAPFLCDLDGDGDIELVALAADGRLYVWDLEGDYDPSTMDWPMSRHDKEHTALYQSHTDNQAPTLFGPIKLMGLIIWFGHDPEDKRNLEYSYRVDGSEWSSESIISTGLLNILPLRSLKLSKGIHTLQIMAEDTQGTSIVGEIELTVYRARDIGGAS